MNRTQVFRLVDAGSEIGGIQRPFLAEYSRRAASARCVPCLGLRADQDEVLENSVEYDGEGF